MPAAAYNSSTARGGDRHRSEPAQRFKGHHLSQQNEDLTPDYMNILGMLFSMCGLMMRLKWCAWVALYCSCVSFANSRINDDSKQIFSSFMLSISAIVMSYIQNPQPMSPPWAANFSTPSGTTLFTEDESNHSIFTHYDCITTCCPSVLSQMEQYENAERSSNFIASTSKNALLGIKLKTE